MSYLADAYDSKEGLNKLYCYFNQHVDPAMLAGLDYKRLPS